jgi:hypothetical protein
MAALALAATPIADAATGRTTKAKTPVPVAHARFADTAGRLGGYRVSKVPAPNTLLPLGADGRFPSSALTSALAGTRGAAGPTGPRGPAGPAGRDSPGVVTIVFQADGTSKDPTNGAAEAVCASGTKVLGGGFKDLTRTFDNLAGKLPPGSVDEVVENEPFARSDGSSGWRVRIVNVPSPAMVSGGTVVPNTLPAGSTYFQSYAICG